MTGWGAYSLRTWLDSTIMLLFFYCTICSTKKLLINSYHSQVKLVEYIVNSEFIHHMNSEEDSDN